MSSGRLEFGGNTADLEVSEPGTGAHKSKNPIHREKYRAF